MRDWTRSLRRWQKLIAARMGKTAWAAFFEGPNVIGDCNYQDNWASVRSPRSRLRDRSDVASRFGSRKHRFCSIAEQREEQLCPAGCLPGRQDEHVEADIRD